MSEQRFAHEHSPVLRVVRAGWDDPLAAGFSRGSADPRWNTTEFAALYCCCGELVARAVALDVFRLAGVEIEDLQPAFRPQLAEVAWQGEVVDMVTGEGVKAAGFPPSYPEKVDKAETRAAAERWFTSGAEGVCCRSASLARLGRSSWVGDYRAFAEIAVFVDNAEWTPRLLRRRLDLDWLKPTLPST